jgi:putative oligomerization/nucleic acid binding protein
MAMTPEEIIEAKSRLYGGLNRVLEPGEQVLVIVVGALRQAVVGTDRRLFVYKAGNQAGVMFGRRAKSWNYADVANLRLDIGQKGGVLTVVPVVPDEEILAYGASGHGTPQQSPNAITFASKPGTAIAARVQALLELVAAAHRAQPATGPSTSQPPPSAERPPPDPFEEIRKLGELRSAGLLTEEEFTAKKAQLLDRI